jgi:hypothetical protein
LGVTRSAVTKAVRTGRITPGPDGLFNLEEAAREWRANTRQRLPRDADESYSRWQQRKVHYRAQLAKLEYEQKLGLWLDKEAVDYALTDVATAARVAFETAPDRLAPELASCGDAVECRRILAREIARILRDINAHVERARDELTRSAAG